MRHRHINMGRGIFFCIAIFLVLGGGVQAQEDVFDLSHLYDDLESEETVDEALPADDFADLMSFEVVEPIGIEADVVEPIEIPEAVGEPVVTPAPVVVQTRIEELEQLLAVRDNQVRELKLALEEMTTEFGQRVAALRAGQGIDDVRELVERQTEFEIANHELVQLREALAQREQEYANVMAMHTAMQAEAAVADGQITDFKARLTESEGVILMLGSERDALQQRVHDLDQTLATTLSEMDQAVRLQSDRLDANLQEKESQFVEFEQQLRSEHAATQAQLLAAEDQIADLRAALAESDVVVAGLRKERDLLQQRLDVRDRELGQVLSETDSTVKMQTQRLEAVLQAKDAELAAVKAQAQSEQEAALAGLRAANMAAQTARDAELMGRLRSLESEHAAALAALESKHAEVVSSMSAAHSAALAGLQREFDDYRAASEPSLDAAAQLRSDVARLEAALQVARTENTQERFKLAYNSGSLFLAAGHYERAEEAFAKALAIREDDGPLHYNMGILYDEHLRQPAKARKHYERFLALSPNDRDAPMVQQWLRELR